MFFIDISDILHHSLLIPFASTAAGLTLFWLAEIADSRQRKTLIKNQTSSPKELFDYQTFKVILPKGYQDELCKNPLDEANQEILKLTDQRVQSFGWKELSDLWRSWRSIGAPIRRTQIHFINQALKKKFDEKITEISPSFDFSPNDQETNVFTLNVEDCLDANSVAEKPRQLLKD